MNENDKNNDGGLNEMMYLAPVGELTSTQLSNVMTAFSNVVLGWMKEDGHDVDTVKMRNGINNLFTHKVTSYPDKCCMDILYMVLDEGRDVPVRVEHLNKCLRKSKGFGQ